MLRPLVAASIAVFAAMPAAARTSVMPPSPIKPKLQGRVSLRAISLRTANGGQVGALWQNQYLFVIKDVSKAQNFHLIGPGVNRKTRVAATTTTSWTVNLSPGRYVYRSDRSSRLRGTFLVKSGPPPV